MDFNVVRKIQTFVLATTFLWFKPSDDDNPLYVILNNLKNYDGTISIPDYFLNSSINDIMLVNEKFCYFSQNLVSK